MPCDPPASRPRIRSTSCPGPARSGAHLAEQGWPEPVLADSGNGGHLLYRVDLPANDGGSSIGSARLAFFFEDGQVNVDRTVFNPGRIWKLYGTVARKGTTRPCDRTGAPAGDARLLVPVGVTCWRRWPRSRPRTRQRGPRPGQAAREFDLAAWIEAHGLAVEASHMGRPGRSAGSSRSVPGTRPTGAAPTSCALPGKRSRPAATITAAGQRLARPAETG
jgi:hypothetical protein